MDKEVLESLVAEMRPRLLGRKLVRARAVGTHAIAFALRSESLWIEASRGAAGLYLLGRADAASLQEGDEADPRTRHLLLLLRKHCEGRSISGLEVLPGGRALLLEAGTVTLSVKVSPPPAATLTVGGTSLGSFGEGRSGWPVGEPRSEGRDAPPRGAEPPRPAVSLPRPYEECTDLDLAETPATIGNRSRGPYEARVSSWVEAASLFFRARTRGLRFERRRRTLLSEARRERARLERLFGHLREDIARLPSADEIRRSADALLAAPSLVGPGASEVDLPDPYSPGRTIRIVLDPRLSAPGNADRTYEKARRIDRARVQVTARLAEVKAALETAEAREKRAREARNLDELVGGPAREERTRQGTRHRRHYLTSRGVSLLVGRGARENHELTFSVAGPEDLWLHVRDAPGAHVILRDPEGRAGAEDVREAAEVAAFFSEVKGESRADVHVARRKHIRPAGSGPGRVHVTHSETIRVSPRDPEGRLRRR